MPVERSTPSTSGKLTLKMEPGVYMTSVRSGEVDVSIYGAQGVRFLGTLIEEATALRDELRAVVG